MLVKLLKIYRPIEIHEIRHNDNPLPGIVVFKRNVGVSCNKCSWNEYFGYMCSRYLLVFKEPNGIIRKKTACSMCMCFLKSNEGNKKYTLKSIKRITL